jgi:predicted RNA methylase
MAAMQHATLLRHLCTDFKNSGFSTADGVLALSIEMLRCGHLLNNDWETRPGNRIEQLLCSWLRESDEPERVRHLFANYYLPHCNNDLLGTFYQSIQNNAKKSTMGAYYTPAELLQGITISPGNTVYDPCCGSGGILLKVLTQNHDPAMVFASDIDEIAVKICTINLALFFNNAAITSTVIKGDTVFVEENFMAGKKYDCIITNPPWGSKFTPKQKNDLLIRYPELETTETFSIVLQNSLDLLKKDGNLYFFMPHAFLTVARHKKIRQKIVQAGGSLSLKLLGNEFRGVMSKGILLHFEASGLNINTITVTDINNNKYFIDKSRITTPDFIINAFINNFDLNIIKKIYAVSHTSLRENTIFALGIVTGNNNKLIAAKNSAGFEAFYRGKDIFPFRLLPNPKCFIVFRPELFQQTAPKEYYRQKKIVYRFIGKRLICALDTSNALLLNSANLFIPRAYPMETIICLFNSPIYSFIFQKKFNSIKILKSHLQDLPLPLFTGEQHSLFKLIHDEITGGKIPLQKAQAEIDAILIKIFMLTSSEYEKIKEAVPNLKF